MARSSRKARPSASSPILDTRTRGVSSTRSSTSGETNDPRDGHERAVEAAHLRRLVEVEALDAVDLEPPDARSVRLGDTRLQCLDWGGAGRPLLFLHGYGLNAHTWDAVVLGLRHRYRCLAPDLRGHGGSDWGEARDYVLDARADEAGTLAVELGLDRLAVVGHSLGALVSLALGARHPDLVEAVVVVDASPFAGAPKRQRANATLLRNRVFDSFETAFALVRRASPQRDPELLRRNLARNLRERDDGAWTWRHDPSPAMLTPEDRAERNRRLAESLAGVDCPVLVARGAESRAASPAAASALVAALPDARAVEIARAGHNVQGDNPRDLASAISGFLEGLGYR